MDGFCFIKLVCEFYHAVNFFVIAYYSDNIYCITIKKQRYMKLLYNIFGFYLFITLKINCFEVQNKNEIETFITLAVSQCRYKLKSNKTYAESPIISYFLKGQPEKVFLLLIHLGK